MTYSYTLLVEVPKAHHCWVAVPWANLPFSWQNPIFGWCFCQKIPPETCFVKTIHLINTLPRDRRMVLSQKVVRRRPVGLQFQRSWGVISAIPMAHGSSIEIWALVKKNLGMGQTQKRGCFNGFYKFYHESTWFHEETSWLHQPEKWAFHWPKTRIHQLWMLRHPVQYEIVVAKDRMQRKSMLWGFQKPNHVIPTRWEYTCSDLKQDD